MDEVTRDLFVLIKEDWNPNKPEHSDEDDEDEDSIEVDIAPKLAIQAMKFFKNVYSLPELCAIGECDPAKLCNCFIEFCLIIPIQPANEKLSKIFVRNLFEFLLASMNKEIFFDDDVDLRFAQQELVDLMYRNVPYLFQVRNIIAFVTTDNKKSRGWFICGFLKRELTLLQDACKQKYVRALKAVIINAQEADIDVLVEKMESCLDTLLGSV